jgi:hypothetical protein
MTTRTRRLVRPIVFIGAALALFVPPGSAFASAARPTVYSVRTGGTVTLADAGGVPTTIESMLIPRGAWTVTANVTAVDFGTGDFVRCTLQQDGTAFDGGATTYVDDTVADLTNSGALKTSAAATTVALVCGHDQNATSGSQFYLDPGATLTAVEGGPIKGATAAATTGPNVVQKRTTAQTPLGKATSTPVEQVRVDAGTWVFHVNLSLVNFSGFDFADCALFEHTDGIASQQVVVGDADVVVSNVSIQGARTFATTTTVKLACSASETTGVYVDPGATLIATRVAPSDVVEGFDTKGVLPDTGGQNAVVFRQSMPAGAWRVSSAQTTVVSNPNNSIGGATDFVRCGLYSGGQLIDGAATVLISQGTDGGNYKQMIVESATHTAKKAWTLSLRCSHDVTISTGSHWLVYSTSPVVAIQQGPIESSVI